VNVFKWSAGALVACAVSAGTASAQYGYGQPTPASPGRDYTSYFAQDEPQASPSDRPVEEAPEAPADGAASAAAANGGVVYGCDGSCGGGCQSCCGLNCPEEDPWRLFPCGLGCGVDVYGWASGGFTGNFSDPADRYNGPVTFNDRDDGQFNQLYLVMERAVDNGGYGWDLGGRVDLLYGTDHRFTTALGLEDNWNEDSRFYGLAMPQLYAEVAYNDLAVKVGHYYTIIGYEVVQATGNFFYSHSYTHQYGEPFTHTGALASYAYSDTTTLYGGFDRGWDNWEDNNDDLSFLGGVSWDGGNGTTLAVATTIGDEPSAVSDEAERFMYSLVYSNELTDRWTYVFQHDNGHQDNGAGAGQDAEWYGINQYLFYKINCCWSFGTEFEWFRDDDGTRVTGIGDGNTIAGDSFVGNFYQLKAGLNYKPNANFVFRPELRYDWYDGAADPVSGNLPYDDGTDDDQLTAAFDVIFLY
jgi:hypothetical protein